GGSGTDTLRFASEVSGTLTLSGNRLTFGGVTTEYTGIQNLEVVIKQGTEKKGTVNVTGELAFTGNVILEAKTINVSAAITADNLSLTMENLLVIGQDLDVSNGAGDVVILTADQIRIAADAGIGSPAQPIYIQPKDATNVQKFEAVTQGAAGIYVTAIRDLEIGNVDIAGITDMSDMNAGLYTGSGGAISLTGLSGGIQISEMINATGGDITITTEAIDILANVRSWNGGPTDPRGRLLLQPLTVTRSIGIAGATGEFNISSSELDWIIDGFDDITIGRADGMHHIIIGSYLFRDSVTFNSPVLGGSIFVPGKITTTTADVYVILNGPSA
ncbi:hypothetical protein ACFL9U_06615, partial [Thermodesulfobacteriota bacterium]